jgi:23S rRNA (uracil1939-C5)-methyltransferase
VARRRTGPETGTIASVTHDGRGIVHGEGKKVFVAGALAGEEVRYQRRKRRRNFDEAELLEVIVASPERVSARCAAFGRCGGCSLQHVSPEQQREIKFRTLKDSLERIGGVEPREWLDPVVGEAWNYRRRARLAVKDVQAKGRVLVGFRERHAPFITDMHRCEVLAAPLDDWIDPLSDLIGQLSIRDRLPQVEVSVGENAVALVFRVLDSPDADDHARLAAFGRERGADIWLQTAGLDSLRPLDAAACSTELTYSLPDFEVEIAFLPLDFVQVNADINRRLVARAIDLLDVEAGHRVLDLFCGIGNFSLPLARRSGQVLGVEGEAAMVARARENARRNGLDNAEFRAADLAELDGNEAWLSGGWDRLLLDPARNGAAAVVDNIGAIGAARIVYVSCHPGTLARDAGKLVREHGYQIESAGIVDMFPHTAHVESIAVFTK